MVSNMKYEILNDAGEVINTIVADQAFVDEHFTGMYREVQENPDVVNALLAAEIRQKRDALLSVTDWRFRSDLNPSQAWKDYCQALRDVPQQADFPTNVTWPTQPE